MQTKNDSAADEKDTIPPWPSEPPIASEEAPVIGDRVSGMMLTGDPRIAALEERLAEVLRQREQDAEQMAKMAADLTRLDDLARAEKNLRESSLVQIRRLVALEREVDTAKNALQTASNERDELRSRAQSLSDELLALKEAFIIADSAARNAAAALETVTRALEVAGSGTKR